MLQTGTTYSIVAWVQSVMNVEAKKGAEDLKDASTKTRTRNLCFDTML